MCPPHPIPGAYCSLPSPEINKKGWFIPVKTEFIIITHPSRKKEVDKKICSCQKSEYDFKKSIIIMENVIVEKIKNNHKNKCKIYNNYSGICIISGV